MRKHASQVASDCGEDDRIGGAGWEEGEGGRVALGTNGIGGDTRGDRAQGREWGDARADEVGGAIETWNCVDTHGLVAGDAVGAGKRSALLDETSIRNRTHADKAQAVVEGATDSVVGVVKTA